ncbi:hypothetical protein SBA4_2940007 [Candidatus Sulfopaludibacter sp. SbA4]|nr:hypothetical protein SBA4_2940007 [Candidatus Sulfopaludibacter sp. SbA4]
MAAAGKILADLESVPGRKLLISDGVFSMDGDIGPLPGLVEAAEKHGARCPAWWKRRRSTAPS